jgi:hypothetical protein
MPAAARSLRSLRYLPNGQCLVHLASSDEQGGAGQSTLVIELRQVRRDVARARRAACSQVGEELGEHGHILNLANCAAHTELVIL